MAATLTYTLARPATHAQGDDPSVVHLAWGPGVGEGEAVQVYVDGGLYDAAADTGRREMLLELDRERAHRIELLVVERARASEAMPGRLGGQDPPVGDPATFSLVRDLGLGVDTRVSFGIDGQEIETRPMWAGDVPRAGFGSLFGEGGFGLDAATGPGLGRGELGLGPLGADGSALTWAAPVDKLPAGAHTLTAGAHDAGGRPVASPVSVRAAVDPLPEPAAGLALEDDWTLRWA